MSDALMMARRLADHITNLSDFTWINLRPRYSHVGALLSDAALQSGIKYSTVVLPRVLRIIDKYPHANIMERFCDLLATEGANKVLQWKHPEKPRRLNSLTTCLCEAGISTVTDLRDWLGTESAVRLLLDLRGTGPKTVDYLKILVGCETVAVDRHIRDFTSRSGITVRSYSELRRVCEYAADLLSVPRDCLDRSIWNFATRDGVKVSRRPFASSM